MVTSAQEAAAFAASKPALQAAFIAYIKAIAAVAVKNAEKS